MSYENLRPLQRRFLRCFEACASITLAARWAKCSRQMHYDWLATSPAYAAAFAEAEPRALRRLEDEAVRRASEGVTRAIRYKGKIVGYETEYSDSLLQFLLRQNPKFRDRVEHSGDLSLDAGKNLVEILNRRFDEAREAAKLAEDKLNARELPSGRTS